MKKKKNCPTTVLLCSFLKNTISDKYHLSQPIKIISTFSIYVSIMQTLLMWGGCSMLLTLYGGCGWTKTPPSVRWSDCFTCSSLIARWASKYLRKAMQVCFPVWRLAKISSSLKRAPWSSKFKISRVLIFSTKVEWKEKNFISSHFRKKQHLQFSAAPV